MIAYHHISRTRLFRPYSLISRQTTCSSSSSKPSKASKTTLWCECTVAYLSQTRSLSISTKVWTRSTSSSRDKFASLTRQAAMTSSFCHRNHGLVIIRLFFSLDQASVSVPKKETRMWFACALMHRRLMMPSIISRGASTLCSRDHFSVARLSWTNTSCSRRNYSANNR